MPKISLKDQMPKGIKYSRKRNFHYFVITGKQCKVSRQWSRGQTIFYDPIDPRKYSLSDSDSNGYSIFTLNLLCAHAPASPMHLLINFESLKIHRIFPNQRTPSGRATRELVFSWEG